MAVAPSELHPDRDLPIDSVLSAELLDRESGQWQPHTLIGIHADWVEQTLSGLRPVYDTNEDQAQNHNYERDIRPGVIAVSLTDEVIACNSLIIVAKNGRRTLVSSMMHSPSRQPGLVANTFSPQPQLRAVPPPNPNLR